VDATNHWDADSAIQHCPTIAWRGSAWRIHRQKYDATDPGGSLKVSGRYHRGLDRYPSNQVWPALYLALSPETCMGELIRHVSPDMLPAMNSFRLSQLLVRLSRVLDCRDTSLLDLSIDDLCNDIDYQITQQLGAAAAAGGYEGLLVPSATRLGDNLIVFPLNLQPASTIETVSSREPRLYVPRRPSDD
jgi:RES domain-containing protein